MLALSTCPGGDLSVFGWGEEAAQGMLETCRPLGVAVYEIDSNLKTEILKDWQESASPGYNGMHGIGFPVFGK